MWPLIDCVEILSQPLLGQFATNGGKPCLRTSCYGVIMFTSDNPRAKELIQNMAAGKHTTDAYPFQVNWGTLRTDFSYLERIARAGDDNRLCLWQFLHAPPPLWISASLGGVVDDDSAVRQASIDIPKEYYSGMQALIDAVHAGHKIPEYSHICGNPQSRRSYISFCHDKLDAWDMSVYGNTGWTQMVMFQLMAYANLQCMPMLGCKYQLHFNASTMEFQQSHVIIEVGHSSVFRKLIEDEVLGEVLLVAPKIAVVTMNQDRQRAATPDDLKVLLDAVRTFNDKSGADQKKGWGSYKNYNLVDRIIVPKACVPMIQAARMWTDGQVVYDRHADKHNTRHQAHQWQQPQNTTCTDKEVNLQLTNFDNLPFDQLKDMGIKYISQVCQQSVASNRSDRLPGLPTQLDISPIPGERDYLKLRLTTDPAVAGWLCKVQTFINVHNVHSSTMKSISCSSSAHQIYKSDMVAQFGKLSLTDMNYAQAFPTGGQEVYVGAGSSSTCIPGAASASMASPCYGAAAGAAPVGTQGSEGWLNLG